MSEETRSLIPLATPYTDDGRSVSEIRLARLIRFWKERGQLSFYLCGETGEFGMLSLSERKYMLEVVQRETQGAAFVVVNVTCLSTDSALDLAQHASRHGARMAWLMPPFFGEYTEAEYLHHFRTVNQFAGIPVIMGDPLGTLAGKLDVYGLRTSQAATVDQWCFEGFEVDCIGVIQSLIPDASYEAVANAANRVGVAPIMKSVLYGLGLELGSPRSPKLGLDPRELRALLASAAA